MTEKKSKQGTKASVFSPGEVVWSSVPNHCGRYEFIRMGPATSVCEHNIPVTVRRIKWDGTLASMTECFDLSELTSENSFK